MLDFAALDVALGLIFVYFVLALVCSALNETIASALSWRSKFLREGVANLLDPTDQSKGKVIAAVLYDHPIVNALSGRWMVGTRTTSGRWPIYVYCGAAGSLQTSFFVR